MFMGYFNSRLIELLLGLSVFAVSIIYITV